MTLNVVTGDALIELEAFGGHSPAVNSRVRIGSKARELQFLDERDFTTDADRLGNRQYADWLDRHDIGYSCVTPLLRNGGLLVGLAAIRTRSQEVMDASERRDFMVLAANIRSAVNLATAVEAQKADTLATALSASKVPAFVCDGAGRVIAVSDQSEALLSAGRFGRMMDGVFAPRLATERSQFNSALKEAILPSRGAIGAPPRPVVLTGEDGTKAIAEFIPLQKDSGFTFTARVLVLIRGADPRRVRDARLAQELFGLTAAEAKVAVQLLEGRSPQEIAALSGASVGTVRNHIHRILSKAHCRSQVEFLAVMSNYT